MYEGLAGLVFPEKKSKGHEGAFKASRLEAALKGVVEAKLGSGRSEVLMVEDRMDGGQYEV